MLTRTTVWISKQAARPTALVLAIVTTLAWFATYPLFNSVDSWQMVYNTLTSVVTYVLLFVLTYSQARDTTAINIKLDAILAAQHNVSNDLIAIEEETDEKMEAIKASLVEEKCPPAA